MTTTTTTTTTSPSDDSPTDPYRDTHHANRGMSNTPTSEGYPSWLPRRAPAPVPASTIHSRAGTDSPFGIHGRRATPRSVRIINMSTDDSQNAMDREPTDHTRVGSSPLVSPRDRVWSRAAGKKIVAPLGAALDAQLSTTIKPRFRANGLHPELLRNPSLLSKVHYWFLPLLVFGHIPIQTYFDFSAVFILFQVAKYPYAASPGVPGSGTNWIFGAAIYILCWFIWIFGIFLIYEVLYSFVRRWRFKRPLILPVYLSAPAYRLASLTSYTTFCFLSHIRSSAWSPSSPYSQGANTSDPSFDGNPRAESPTQNAFVLGGSGGSFRQGISETFHFYSQNLPTVMTLLPRAGLSLALLLAFTNPDPGYLALLSQGAVGRDSTYFDSPSGVLSTYAKVVLWLNVAWTAWRVLVLVVSWLGLWIVSGMACGGICGPRDRYEEEEAVEKSRRRSYFSSDDQDEAEEESLPWVWKEMTVLRIQETFEFCLNAGNKMNEKGGVRLLGDPPASIAGFEGMEAVLAAVGFPQAAAVGVPPITRRGALTGDFFQAPATTLEQSGDIEVVRRSKENIAIQYPFSGKGAQVSSKDRIVKSELVPFPPSPRTSRDGRSKSSLEAADDYEDEEEEDPISPTSDGEPRSSMSMSSLGRPIVSRYPFQIRRPSSNGSHQTGVLSASSGKHSRISQSTGNFESSDSASRSGSIPMPPRHPHPQAGRGRQRAGTVPSAVGSSPSSSSLGHVPPVPTIGGPRERASMGMFVRESHLDMDLSHEELSQHRGVDTSAELDIAESDMNHLSVDDSHAQPRLSSETAERDDDVVALLSESARPSPHTSSVDLRRRSSHGFLGAHRSSRHNSHASGSGSGTSSAGSRSRTGSSLSVSMSVASAAARQRAQSLVQGLGAASRSSVEFVHDRIGSRHRANSSMARLEEDAATSSAGSPAPIHQWLPSHSRNTSAFSGSDAHASGSGSGGRSSSDYGAGRSSGENYTFGQPFRLPMIPRTEREEQEPEQEQEHALTSQTPSSAHLSTVAPSENTLGQPTPATTVTPGRSTPPQ